MSTIEEELRAAFHQGTEQLATTTDPWSRTTRAVARSRARRRAAGVGVVAIAAATAVAVTAGPWPVMRAEPPADRTRQTAPVDDVRVAVRPGQGRGATVTTVEAERWGTRGSLADRADVLAQLRARFAGPGVSVLSVPYAGEVDGTSIAVVITEAGEGGTGGTVPAAQLVYGAAGTPVSRWTEPNAQEARPSGQGAITAVLLGMDGTVRVVALTLSRGATVRISPAPTYDQDGTPGHRYRNLPLENGVGIATFRARSVAGVSIAADLGDAGTGEPLPTEANLSASEYELPAVPDEAFAAAVAAPSCRGLLPAGELAGLVSQLLERQGLTVAEVSVRTVWCRKVDGGIATVAATTTRDGTVFQSAAVIPGADAPDAEQGYIAAVLGRPVPRSSQGNAPLVFTRPELADPDPVPVFVSAPGAARVELVADQQDGTSVLVRSAVDADGFAALSLTKEQWETLSVTGDVALKDASGRQIARVPVMNVRDLDPMGLFPEGSAG